MYCSLNRTYINVMIFYPQCNKTLVMFNVKDQDLILSKSGFEVPRPKAAESFEGEAEEWHNKDLIEK
ncbi:unnamed protein product [Citrullus colocynthis]|uniref:Uncharacterized protein n=1 Tax=Citrullus colocynthis TaxID=252529 RepID=A0ABP0XLN3_9ROSI